MTSGRTFVFILNSKNPSLKSSKFVIRSFKQLFMTGKKKAQILMVLLWFAFVEFRRGHRYQGDLLSSLG